MVTIIILIVIASLTLNDYYNVFIHKELVQLIILDKNYWKPYSAIVDVFYAVLVYIFSRVLQNLLLYKLVIKIVN